eukprot:m.84602 g.84602  ORF g.84602 m.84602 type:complete len:550 (+) comp25772_c0_seq4:193-1842(+)
MSAMPNEATAPKSKRRRVDGSKSSTKKKNSKSKLQAVDTGDGRSDEDEITPKKSVKKVVKLKTKKSLKKTKKVQVDEIVEQDLNDELSTMIDANNAHNLGAETAEDEQTATATNTVTPKLQLISAPTNNITSFEQLELAPWIVKQCGAVGMNKPTEVQVGVIPQVLKGFDVCGYAKTGSGKTAAFALPILQNLSKDPYGVYAIVLTPTRELAVQIGEQFTALGNPIGLRCCVIVGGLDMMKQGLELSRRPHVIVATPGRLADHICSGDGVRLKRVKYLVLDEADRLLDNESFGPNLDTIFKALPASRQTLLFSATAITKNIAVLETLRQPVITFEVKSDIATVSKLKQEYLLTPAHVRHCYFVNLMLALKVDEKKSSSCIVFTSTCRSCEEIALLLQELNIKCVALHSQMSQSDRLGNLARFRSSYVKILVATDVASRGLDIAPVGMVVNFNIPKAVNDYIHRVGRTARAGRDGRSVTLMSEHDVDLLHAVEERVGIKMAAFDGLKEDDVLRMLSKVNVARRAVNLKLLEQNFGHRKQKRKAQKLAAEE